MKYEHKGRVWWLVGQRPYTRRDGSETVLDVWQSLCAECVGPFEVAVPAEAMPGNSNGFETVHCTEHRLTSSQALARGRRAQREKRRVERAQKNAERKNLLASQGGAA
jgi:hypothetical protein